MRVRSFEKYIYEIKFFFTKNRKRYVFQHKSLHTINKYIDNIERTHFSVNIEVIVIKRFALQQKLSCLFHEIKSFQIYVRK